MILFDLFAWIIFIFLGFYLLLQLYIISCSSRGRIIDIERRNYTPKYQQNITAIVYSHNNAATIIDLIESLKKQDYDKDKYSINVILDNCDDNSAKLLEILGGTRLWRISTDIKPIGKNKAIAWLLERILSGENTNAFVFLNADCIVKSDFLSKVNAAIDENPVLIGEVLSLNHYPELFTGLHCFKNKIRNRVFTHGRNYACLGNFLDQDLFAIRQDILEKVKLSVTDYGFEEYEYSIDLNQSKIQVATSSNLRVFKQFSESLKSIALAEHIKRYKSFITFKNNFKLLFSQQSFTTKELILSLLYPSSITFIILASGLLWYSMKTNGFFASYISFEIPAILLIVYLFSRFTSLFAARSTFNDYKNGILWIFFAPIVYIMSFLVGIRIKLPFKISLPKKSSSHDTTKNYVNATITDGKKELTCQLEIRQSEQNSQIIFIFKDKKLASQKHLRIDHALEELLEKLKIHGFALKVCMNCGYFKQNEAIAAKFSGEQGYCLFDNVDKGLKAHEFTYIWNSCSNIIPSQARNYIQQQLSKNKE